MHCIVLSRRDFREYDQIISVYTKDFGKMELLARSVKKITSKQSAHLEPFSLVDMEYAQGKEVDHLIKVYPINIFKEIRIDFTKSMAAQYVVSLTNQLTHTGEKDERLFNVLTSWLEYVNLQSAIRNPQLVDAYIVSLLHCLGFWISEHAQDGALKRVLEILESGDWEKIDSLELSSHTASAMHTAVYQFAVHHIEKKIPDWAHVMERV